MIAGLAIALLAAPSVPATGNSPGPVWRDVYPRDTVEPRDPTPVVVANEGVTVTITPPPPLPDGRASWEDAQFIVQFPGLPPYEVPQDETRESAFGIWIGIGRMAETDPAPTVLIAGYTGGMHCCNTLQAVSLADRRPASVVLPRSEHGLDQFPKDVDGDGRRDIRWGDDSLLYAFTSYADSRVVPRFYNLRGGELVDMSREPGFAPIYRDFAEGMLRDCRGLRRSANAGVCAAYAYAMAVQGRAEQGIETAVALATEMTVSTSECTSDFVHFECPSGETVAYRGFENVLRSKMRKHGYLP